MDNVREHWSSKLGFLFAAIGSAIGLGVLWKFPYTVGRNGGGVFLLTYVFFTLVIGIPVFIGELLIGRKTQRAAIGAFTVLSKNKSDVWKIGGWLGVISSFLIMSFYSVIAGWGMCYIFMSLCRFYEGLTSMGIAQVFTTLSQSGDISLLWSFLFTLWTMVIVFSGVRKGIEFWSKFMTRALLFILLALALYNLTLSGFNDALKYLFIPDFSAFSFSSAIEALGLAFFTMSLGQGIMISYGSYLHEKESLPQMATFVGLAVVIIAILAALVVFPVVFTYGFEPSAGTGLIFQTLPFLFAKLPGSHVISCAFFILLVFTALTSAIAFIEVVSANLMELTQFSRKKAVLYVSLATFIVGIPSALSGARGIFYDWPLIYGTPFLETIDNLVSTWLIPIGGLVTCLFIGWSLPIEVTKAEFFKGSPSKILFQVWHFTMKWIAPIMILLIILEKTRLI